MRNEGYMNYKKIIIMGLFIIAGMVPLPAMQQARALPTQQTTMRELTTLATIQQLYNTQETIQDKTMFVQHIMNQVMVASWDNNFSIQDQIRILYNLKFTLLANVQTLTREGTGWLGFLSTNSHEQMINRLQLLISEIDKNIIELEFKAESWASYLTRNVPKYGVAAIIIALAAWQAKNLAQETRFFKWLAGTSIPTDSTTIQDDQSAQYKKSIDHLVQERELFVEETDRNAQLIENLEDVIQTAQQEIARHENNEALTEEQQEFIDQLQADKIAAQEAVEKISNEQKYNLAQIEALINRQIADEETTTAQQDIIDRLKSDYAKLSDESQKASIELQKAQENIEQLKDGFKKSYEGPTLFGDEPLITGKDITEFSSELLHRAAKPFERIYPDPHVDYGHSYNDDIQPGASMAESMSNGWQSLLDNINNSKE